MSVLMIGVSHKTAPVHLREHLAIPRDRLGAALLQLQSMDGLKEAVLLSTCNRLEIYARPVDDKKKTLSALFSFVEHLYDAPAIKHSIYHHEDRDAIQQLFRVAAGLDSLVVGETDVLGQVKTAYTVAQEHKTTGKITNVLFQRALFVGKAVRTNTGISDGSSSVGSMAVRLAEQIFGRLENHKIILIGAGKMAKVTVRNLMSLKAGELTILNRTKAKAEALAKKLDGKAGSLDELPQVLHHADIVICSAHVTEPIVTRAMMEPIMNERKMKPLYFIDIGVPRNVAGDVHPIENVYVYNIDDLQNIVEENISKRKKEIHVAETMVQQLADEFHEWVQAVLAGSNKALRHNI